VAGTEGLKKKDKRSRGVVARHCTRADKSWRSKTFKKEAARVGLGKKERKASAEE